MFIARKLVGDATEYRSRDTGKSYIIRTLSSGYSAHTKGMTMFTRTRRRLMEMIETFDKN